MRRLRHLLLITCRALLLGIRRRRRRDDGLRPKVRIVAVASNEGAYISEWLHHHLAFGADSIEIVVNRTEDHTREIISSIASRDPRVRLIDGDALERGGPGSSSIQEPAYLQARNRASDTLGPEDYILFLDIDEYWVPRDLRTSLTDYLIEAGRPGIASFNWAQVTGDDVEFERTLAPDLRVRMDPHLKTAVRMDVPVRRLTAHTCYAIGPVRRHVASGIRLSRGDKGRTISAPRDLPPAFVLHRMFRSPVEYLAILGRKRPHSYHDPFKTNRFGYRVTGSSAPDETIRLDPVRIEEMRASYRRFVEENGIGTMMESDRTFVRRQARATLERYHALTPDERAIWIHGFLNLDLEGLADRLAGPN